MPDFRRYFTPGGTFFFTVVTHNRHPIFCSDKARELLRQSIQEIKKGKTFESLAFVLLPEHFHCIWRLPQEDGNFTVRMACIKKMFTKLWLDNGGEEVQISKTRQKHREKGIWQKRFWEHTIRDEDDYINHVNYIHYNPVKHNLAKCPHEWPYSTFHRWMRDGYYQQEWLCVCKSGKLYKPDFDNIKDTVGE
ncbi:MAG: transposase [Sedimentisphaerales bacterium]|nr:transposase [Sedimentisphaerales bacterium]